MADPNGNSAEELPKKDELDLSNSEQREETDQVDQQQVKDMRSEYAKKTDELLAETGEEKGHRIEDWDKMTKEYEERAKEDDEFIKMFEEDLGIVLPTEMRKRIIMSMYLTDKPRHQALWEVRAQLLEESPVKNKLAAEFIDKLIDFYTETAKAAHSTELDIFGVKDTGGFKRVVEDSLKNTFEASMIVLKRSSVEDTNRAILTHQQLPKAMQKIRDIFGELDEGISTGIISESYALQQEKIDNLVDIYGLDHRVFDNSVKRYLELAGIDVANIEFHDAIAKHSKMTASEADEPGADDTEEEPSEE